MNPLEITARLLGGVAMPNGPIMLDALVGWAVVQRDALPYASTAAECVPLPIPIARDEGDRFFLASAAHGIVEANEARWINRRFPVPEAQMLASPKMRNINISAGACKSYRLPLSLSHYMQDRLTWWCLGEPVEIRELLDGIGYLGKRRAVGYGRVARWEVEPCEPWPGFPVVRDGQPLRSLPTDWPGLADGVERAYRTLSQPYWDRASEVLCAVPRWT